MYAKTGLSPSAAFAGLALPVMAAGSVEVDASTGSVTDGPAPASGCFPFSDVTSNPQEDPMVPHRLLNEAG